jgi:putative transposase
MPNYRRALIPGGCFFFTVNLLERRQTLLVDEIAALREAVATTRQGHPFIIDAFVVLPDHLHAVWTLPPGDSDFSTRWRLIKSRFAKALPKQERLSAVRKARGERGIWQRRFWEHLIRDEADYGRHVEYCYINPLKHRSGAFAIGRTRRFIAMCARECFRSIGAAMPKRSVSSASADLGAAWVKPFYRGLLAWNGGLRLRLQSALLLTEPFEMESPSSLPPPPSPPFLAITCRRRQSATMPEAHDCGRFRAEIRRGWRAAARQPCAPARARHRPTRG